MPTLTPGKPITVKDPHLLVENQFTPGRYRFQLVVIDEGGLESDPAELVVTVREIVRPTGPIIRPDILDRIDRLDPIRRTEIIRPIRRPPSQAEGSELTASAIGYQAWLASHMATAPAMLRTTPMPPSARAWRMGRRGARRAVNAQPATSMTSR